MNIRTAFVLAFLAAGSLACAGLTGGVPSASLTEPWTTLDFPTDDGTVMFSDGGSMSVMYDGNKVKELTPKYRDALTKAGYTKVVEAEQGDTTSLVYGKDGKQCAGAITFANGNTMVGFTLK